MSQNRDMGHPAGLAALAELGCIQPRRKSRSCEQNHGRNHKRNQRGAQADAELGSIADGTDDLRRECISEQVNAEEVD